MIIQFRDYLELTKSLVEEDRRGINQIIDSIDEIYSIKKKNGKVIDLSDFFHSTSKKELEKVSCDDKKESEEEKLYRHILDSLDSDSFNEKHYSHYHSYGGYSSSCGGGRSSC